MKSWKKFFLFVLLFIVVNYSYGQGCSQCKMVVEQSSELSEGSFGSNMNMGILYLMAVPYILLFLLFRKRIFSFFREMRS